MKRLVDLATCHATQTTHETSGKGDWVVYNEERDIIHRFPKEWTEKQVMAAIHFGRKFELIALNKGVDHQKSKNPQVIKDLQALVKKLTERNDLMKSENEKIANELDILTLKNT